MTGNTKPRDLLEHLPHLTSTPSSFPCGSPMTSGCGCWRSVTRATHSRGGCRGKTGHYGHGGHAGHRTVVKKIMLQGSSVWTEIDPRIHAMVTEHGEVCTSVFYLSSAFPLVHTLFSSLSLCRTKTRLSNLAHKIFTHSSACMHINLIMQAPLQITKGGVSTGHIM